MKIAVIVPCRNERSNIEECIRAIFDSEFQDETAVEVIIVDGKSDDGTLALIVELQRDFETLKVVTNEQQLTPFAFNLGIRAAGQADFIQIVGARQVLSKNYLELAMRNLLENSEIGCVGGGVHNVYLNEIGEIIAKAMSTSFGMGLGNFRTAKESAFVDTVGTPMYRYSIFEEIGFFDEELIRNQDDEFNYRLTQSGKKIYLNNDISVKYYVRGNFQGLWRQFFQYGYWKVYVNKKHSAITTVRQLIPPMFVLYVFLLPLTLILGSIFFGIAAIPIIVYLTVMLIISVRIGKHINEIVPTAKTFLILHFSYGLGYLKGIAHFLILNKRPSAKEKRLSR